MRVMVTGHSMCAPRQIRFWKYLASLGHTVRVLAPRKWLFHEVEDCEEGNFSIKGVELFGSLRVRGLLDEVKEFQPDVLYCNEPTFSGGALQAVQVGKSLGVKVAIFDWDNVRHTSPMELPVLKNADLFICGCPGAIRVMIEKGVPKERVWQEPIIQVGVDTDLFRPLETERDFDTVTCAGFTENKGLTSIKKVVRELGLRHLWLGASRPYDRLDEPLDYGHVAGWQAYEELPKWYNRAKVHVLFSRDTPEWREQYGYAIAESLACGLPNIISDAGEFPAMWGDCEAVKVIPQGDTSKLRKALSEWIQDNLAIGSGRKFVIKNYGFRTTAQRLVKAFESH